MTIRSGMTELVQLVRQYAQAGTAEYTLGTDTYWSDAHLQDVLDRNRTDAYRESLAYEITYTDANIAQYLDYYFEYGNAERASSGSAIWQVEDAAGSAIGTATYDVEYGARHITFNNSTAGSALYLNYHYYNVEMAASDVWQMKAANVAGNFDVRTDNHDLKRSQKFDQYMKMASYWRARALSSQGANTGESYLIRSDVNP